MKYVYQLVRCEDEGHGNYNQEFILATFLSQEKAQELKEVCEKEAFTNNQDCEYRINEYPVIE